MRLEYLRSHAMFTRELLESVFSDYEIEIKRNDMIAISEYICYIFRKDARLNVGSETPT